MENRAMNVRKSEPSSQEFEQKPIDRGFVAVKLGLGLGRSEIRNRLWEIERTREYTED